MADAGVVQRSTASIIRAAVPADKSSVTLEMMPGSGASGQMILTQKGLATLIQTLGRIHAAMSEGKPIPPFDPRTIPAIVDPHWQLSPGLMGEASAFTFHHAGYGPLGFLVPIDQVEKMIDVLSQHVEQAHASSKIPKN